MYRTTLRIFNGNRPKALYPRPLLRQSTAISTVIHLLRMLLSFRIDSSCLSYLLLLLWFLSLTLLTLSTHTSLILHTKILVFLTISRRNLSLSCHRRQQRFPGIGFQFASHRYPTMRYTIVTQSYTAKSHRITSIHSNLTPNTELQWISLTPQLFLN